MDYSVKQFKLVTGEEVICEVVDETPESMAVRNAFILHEKESVDGYKYFTFRTFMTYQDTPFSVMLIMLDKVVGIAIPSVDMKEQYETALEQMAEQLAEYHEDDEPEVRVKEAPKSNVTSIDDWIRESDGLSLMDSDTDGMIPN